MSADIRHVVVLMLENRSFDCMLGGLYPASATFDGLTGAELNAWHKTDGTDAAVQVWTDAALDPAEICVPDPDPGEAFTDIHQQTTGLSAGGPRVDGTAMGGFVDNYMAQPVSEVAADARAVMHYFTADHVPVISRLARAFGVSDRWFASAPCQTWPNRFFVHTGTAAGKVNNSPAGVPYTMPTVFQRLMDAGQTWRIYFHDFPQTATLGNLWLHPGGFKHFDSFLADAAAGALPAYSFVEPRYFADVVNNQLPNDEHPPHNVAYGEALIAAVYNAVRAGPGWRNTLLVITYDEHGGCFDHVVPPPAISPGGPFPDGFRFDAFGVRVPAVIVSPYIAPGSIIRPAGDTPFDHTSIFKTLQQLFDLDSLTPRSDAAPGLLDQLTSGPDNDGPAAVASAAIAPAPAEIAAAAALPLNGLQQSLSQAAVQLPTAGANIAMHMQRIAMAPASLPIHQAVGDAAAAVAAHMNAFIGTPPENGQLN